MTTPNHIRELFWSNFCLWAFLKEDIRDEFSAATGLALPRSSGLSAAIDAATGYRDHVLLSFLDWITVEMYGLDEAPDAFRADYAARHGGAAA